MRLLSLRLIAFGSFQDRDLDFSADPKALTVVFGRNEAGKSTSLRALEGLLFGIDSTQDAHKHLPKNLRVGGSLISEAGEVLHFTRRRGNKNTLLDSADQPLDEALLKRMLRGVDRELFRTLYGLDHARLRDGAKALLAERTTFAESLFEAGLSGAGVARLVQSLRAEAEALFAPRATTRPINEALKAHAEATKKARAFAMPVVKYRMQIEGIAEAIERRKKAEEDLRKLERARRRLERGNRVAPLLASLRDVVDRRSALGDVVLLPEGATQEREQAIAAQSEAERTLALLERRREEIAVEMRTRERPGLEFDPAEAISTLSQLLGAARDQQLRAELLEERDLLVEMIKERAPAPGVRVDRKKENSVLKRLQARDDAAEQLARVGAEVIDLEAGMVAVTAPAGAGAQELQRIERLSIQLAEAERTLQRASDAEPAKRSALELRGRAEAQFVALGSSLSLDELAMVRAPALEEIEGWLRELESLDDELRRVEARLQELRETRAQLERERGALLAQGAVVSAADVKTARRTRDDVLGQAAEEDRPRATLLRLVPLVHEADVLADRLRLETERSAKLGMLDGSLRENAASLAAQDNALSEPRASIARVLERLASELQRAGAPTIDPAQAPAWLKRRQICLQELAAARRAEEVARSLESERLRAAEALNELLASGAAPRLELAVSRARVELTEQARARADRERSASKLEETTAQLARAKARLGSAEAASREAHAAALEALAAMGLDPDAAREDVVRGMESARSGEQAQAKIERIDAQLERVAESTTRLASYCATLDRALGRERSVADPIAGAELLLEELRRAEKAAAEMRELDLRLSETEHRIRDTIERRDLARAILESSVERAGVAGVPELAEAELRSVRARTLDADRVRIEAQIQAAGDGTSPAELEKELAGFDLEQAELDQERLDEERDALERAKDQAAHDKASLEIALGKFDESNASEHAEQAQIYLARAKSLTLRYVRLRFSSAILERQIESYRKLHQGPVVATAQRYFSRLTGGSFDEIRVILDDDDRPELVCVRSGEEVPIEGLSDGAKDQLFLALRLATIERHAEGLESLPLVLDDVLINFDEDRARATLEVLAGIAPRMQVLLFTHQEKVVELARSALGEAVQVVTL